jgi:Fe-S-cluster-containing hydrogenase component 2
VITQGDGKRVLNTIRAGSYFGETSLLRGGDGKYGARAQAKATTETILFPKELVLEFLDAHDEIRDKFQHKAQSHMIGNPRHLAVPHDSEVARFLVDVAGGFEATDLLVIDETLCIGCDNCEIACAETHGGVSRLNRESGPTHASIHIPTTCRHCENPKCMNECPPDALRRSANGEIFIMDTCIGCGKCADNCPYDVINMTTREEQERPNFLQRLLLRAGAPRSHDDRPKESVAMKCDLCRNLPEPRHGQPRAACVNACPTGAIVRVNPGSYIRELQQP